MSSAANASVLAYRPRLRPDIQWSEYSSGALPTWIARDPLTLEFYHFSDLEKSIACTLDGNLRLSEIMAANSGSGVSEAWLIGFVRQLEQACLLVPTRMRSTAQRLWHNRQVSRRRGWVQRLLSPLAVRTPLFDPSWLLRKCSGLAHFIFSPWLAGFLMVTGLAAAFLVANRLLRDPGSLFAFQELSGGRWLGMLVTYLCVKSLHELGHALACKRWQAECHEIGVLWIAFMPCLYCNTSDSWKLPNRWHRASIAAAGIYVEMFLALIAACLWLLTPDVSGLHIIAANVMVVCSISTLLVNANPLLKYDGYYALSDIWGVPNLSDQSREALGAMAGNWLTGSEDGPRHWDASPYKLALYALLAWLYKQFVLLAIVLAVWVLLNRIGLPLLAMILILTTMAGVTWGYWVSLRRWWRESMKLGSLRVLRVLLTLFLILGLIFAFFGQPLPNFVVSRAVSQFAEMSPVYAPHAGSLIELQPAGASVKAGQVIARLAAPELELRILETRGELATLRVVEERLNLLSVEEDQASADLQTLRENLAMLTERLEILLAERRSLEIVAERDGHLLSGPFQSSTASEEFGDQQQTHPLLHPFNLGSFVQRGTLLGWLGMPEKWKLKACVVENDAQRLSVGMQVSCRWDSNSSDLYRGRVARISPEPVEAFPEPLIGEDRYVLRPGSDGSWLPEQPHYNVDIELQDHPKQLVQNSLATVYIETPRQTCYQLLRMLFDRHLRPSL